MHEWTAAFSLSALGCTLINFCLFSSVYEHKKSMKKGMVAHTSGNFRIDCVFIKKSGQSFIAFLYQSAVILKLLLFCIVNHCVGNIYFYELYENKCYNIFFKETKMMNV